MTTWIVSSSKTSPPVPPSPVRFVVYLSYLHLPLSNHYIHVVRDISPLEKGPCTSSVIEFCFNTWLNLPFDLTEETWSYRCRLTVRKDPRFVTRIISYIQVIGPSGPVGLNPRARGNTRGKGSKRRSEGRGISPKWRKVKVLGRSSKEWCPRNV